jgi:hypothetical protein
MKKTKTTLLPEKKSGHYRTGQVRSSQIAEYEVDTMPRVGEQ